MSKYDWQSIDIVDVIEGRIGRNDLRQCSKEQLIDLAEALIAHNERQAFETCGVSDRPVYVVQDDEIFPGYAGEPLGYQEVSDIPDSHYDDIDFDDNDAYITSHEMAMHYGK